MSYTPTEWQPGDIVTSVKLNKIETELVTLDGDTSQLKSEIEDFGDTYAKIDGSYDTMTVGNAKQLVATVGVEDKEPYLFRTTGGSADVGDRKTMELVGGTVAWNQRGRYSNSPGEWGNSSQTVLETTVVNNTLKCKVVATSGQSVLTFPMDEIKKGHKYLLMCNHSTTTIWSRFGFLDTWTGLGEKISRGLTSTIIEATGDATTQKKRAYINIQPGITPAQPVGTEFEIYSVSVFDLTQMFGSTIADYIDSLETATPGAGVAWFRKLFPKPYYAYDAGTLMSVKTSAHKTVGFNAYDKSAITEDKWFNDYDGTITSVNGYNLSDYIRVIPGATYYRNNTGSSRSLYFDASKTVINTGSWSVPNNTGTFTVPDGAHYIRFTLADANVDTFCINLSWDGERDGEYEPYEAHTYALDSDLELRGIPKLDADNKLYYDGDTYEADGTVTRKYGIRVLNGTEDWQSPDSSGHCWCQDDSIMRSNKAGVPYSEMMISTVKVANNSYAIGNATEPVVTAWGGTTASDDNYWYFAAPNIEDTPTAIKEYLAANPVTIVYMLTTPTEETADPYQTPQIVDDFGTEEFVDTRDVPIPVGHDSVYQANLRAKLEMAPDSPSGDGDYIVRQTNGQNAYVPITFPADELPAAPTEDGSYVLKVTVASGEATYTWEAQS